MSVTSTCRPATDRDLPALLDMEALFPGDRMTRRSWRALLRNPRARVWVIDNDAGMVCANLVCLSRCDTHWWRVYSVVVHPEARGRGLARRLIQAVMNAATVADAAGLRLEVRDDNVAARALYATLGFELRGLRPGYYDDGATAVQLQWRAV
ncbi:GNAT family N-acetyltransferase [Polycyclovorans algicola]|uniref:GNAT family N-acetyltransferase n=1 Tax=Polycyclovorans algicola TaxID=616992 RepID=UPI0004A71441|nr:N-acetyltransferase [Polycyclovorans algicola]